MLKIVGEFITLIKKDSGLYFFNGILKEKITAALSAFLSKEVSHVLIICHSLSSYMICTVHSHRS